MSSAVAAALAAGWWWIALGYFVGAIPMGLVVARARGVDLRAVGSGNIGATNAVRALGGVFGGLVFALDAAKALVPTLLASGHPGDPDGAVTLGAATAAAAITGHIFPIYLRFRGGKGVACAVGAFLALDPWLAVSGLLLYGEGLWLTRTSAVGSLMATTSMTAGLFLAGRPAPLQALGAWACALIFLRHRSNIRDLVREARELKARRAAASATTATTATN
jgi:glycerol-3-phosphate acyltransferase PlsY